MGDFYMYEELLKLVKWRRDYFMNIDFTMLGHEYSQMINAIEELTRKNKELSMQLEEINNKKEDK